MENLEWVVHPVYWGVLKGITQDGRWVVSRFRFEPGVALGPNFCKTMKIRRLL